MKYTIRQFEKDDFKIISEFHRISFKSRYTQNFFKGKYNTTCFFDKYLGFFAVDENNNEGAYYGVFPIKIIYNNKELLAAQSGDTMTLLQHRGKGLFTNLARHTFAYASEVGVAFIFGFPNNNSLPGFKKMGWMFPGSWNKYTIKNSGLDFSTIYKILYKSGMSIPKRIENRLNRFKVEFDEITWKQYLPEGVDGFVLKDKVFFNYKSYSSSMLIEIDGFYIHVKLTASALIIGDISHFDSYRIKDFISAVKKLLSQVCLNNAYLSVSKNHWVNQYFEKENIEGEETDSKIGFYNTSNAAYDFNRFMLSYIDADFY
jgi:hypothetical protein